VRKQILYAPRVRGDLDLGLEPSRIDTLGNKQWAEMNFPGGRLPGRPYQDILAFTPDAIPNYRIGTRRVVGDRVFHYCFASDEGGIDAAGVPVAVTGNPNPQIGCFYNANVHYHGDTANQVDIAINATELDWAYVRTVDGGHVGNIGIAAHELKEAMLVGYTGRIAYLIADNDALDTVAGTVHLYLKRAFYRANAWPASGNTYIYPNKYAQCIHPQIGIAHDGLPLAPQRGYSVVVAVPLIAMTRPCYFWGQTWGPIPIINGLWGINVGDQFNQREFHFDWNGTIVYRQGAEALDAHMQRGGIILSSQFMDLQLAP